MNDTYLHTVDTYNRVLASMLKWLDKSQTFAKLKKFDEDALMTSRLAPDMFPFAKQVQSVCHSAEGQAAILCGKEPPKREYSEKNLADLRKTIERTLSYLATYKPEDFEGCEDRRIPIPTGPGKWIVGNEFVDQIANPNIFFHASMAYAILRHNGVDLGKKDFLGDVNVREG